MNITYTYQIISVDTAARCMEVVYTSDGNPILHVGARLPFEGETTESIIEMYAPVRYWEELKTPVVEVLQGQTGTVVVPPPYITPASEVAVSKRNALLAESDWTQLSDVPLTSEQKSLWAAYRQQLRDITEQSGFPANINWPVKPGISVTVA